LILERKNIYSLYANLFSLNKKRDDLMNRRKSLPIKIIIMALVGVLVLPIAGASLTSPPSEVDENHHPICENCMENASFYKNGSENSIVSDVATTSGAQDSLSDPNGSNEVSVGTLPDPASLLYPSGVLTTGKPTYAWNEVENALFYCLYVNDSLGNVVIKQCYDAEDFKSPTCSVTPLDTLAAGDYSWRIRTWNSDGRSWSLSKAFTICTSSSFPGKATLISPKGTIGTSKPIYTWYPVAGATEYRLKVINVNDPNNPVIDQWNASVEVLSDSKCLIKPDIPLDSGTYKWWIQTRNCKGDGQWSNYLSFKSTNVPPGRASPISPRGLTSTSNPSFIWTAVQGATQYNLQVENDSLIVIDEWFDAEDVTTGTRCKAFETLPVDGPVFYWRIMASNDAGDGSWSGYKYFQTVCGDYAALAKAKANSSANRSEVGLLQNKSQ
jgi:hypothetical protein